jgi:hypothetical protein
LIASGPDSLLLERRLVEPLEPRLLELRPLPPELPLLLRFRVLLRSAIG